MSADERDDALRRMLLAAGKSTPVTLKLHLLEELGGDLGEDLAASVVAGSDRAATMTTTTRPPALRRWDVTADAGARWIVPHTGAGWLEAWLTVWAGDDALFSHRVGRVDAGNTITLAGPITWSVEQAY